MSLTLVFEMVETPRWVQLVCRGVCAGWLLLLAGCECSEADAPPEASAPATAEAPERLAFSAKVPDPAGTWLSARKLLGGSGALLPESVELALARMLHLPNLASGLLDGTVPAGAVALQRGGTLDFVGAIHVRSAGDLVARLSTGADAPYRLERVGRTRHLKAKRPASKALALIGNYLVFADKPSLVDEAGPFLVQELKSQKKGKVGVVAAASRAALRGPLSAYLESLWQTHRADLERSRQAARQAHGRPADFAEPRAVMAAVDSSLDAVLAILRSSRRGELSVELDASAVELSGSLEPLNGGQAAELVTGLERGDAKPLSNLPREAALAVLSRSSKRARLESASEVGAQLSALFGARLSPEEQARLAQLLKHLAHGRGDALTLAAVPRPTPAVVVKSAVVDAEHFRSFTDELWGVLQVGAIARPLDQLLGLGTKPRIRTEQVLGEKVHVASLPLRSKEAGANPAPTVDIVWAEPEGRLDAVLSLGGGVAAFESLSGAKAPALASDPRIARLLGGVHDACWVLLVQADRLGLVPERAGGPSVALLSVGAVERRGTIRLQLSASLVKSVAGVFL